MALLAILGMAAATGLMRISGYWLMGHVPLTARVRKMLEALPGSVVAAIVLPIMVRNGVPAFLAVGAVIAAMLVRRNEFIAIFVGLAVASLARAAF
ncbi:MAG: AzlD domain-containing protein [Pseudorhodoplanes sp.]|nr:AzlD domain-containing protein [Pseudorhodoplanes sp.]